VYQGLSCSDWQVTAPHPPHCFILLDVRKGKMWRSSSLLNPTAITVCSNDVAVFCIFLCIVPWDTQTKSSYVTYSQHFYPRTKNKYAWFSFIVILGWDCICVDLRLLRGSLSIPSDTWVNMEHQWNDTGREKLKVLEKNLFLHYFIHHIPHLNYPRKKPGPPQWEATD
jgi:hypothetical protein